MPDKETVTTVERLTQCLSKFRDAQLQTYTRFAAEIRDQNIEEGAIEEVAFWSSLIQLFVEERDRRHNEVQWLDTLYRLKSERANQDSSSPSSPEDPVSL